MFISYIPNLKFYHRIDIQQLFYWELNNSKPDFHFHHLFHTTGN